MKKYFYPLIFLFFSQDMFSQDVDSNLWITNGPVYSLLRKDTLLFVGGNFDDVGPYTSPLVAVDSNGIRYNTFPKTDGRIDVIKPDGYGGWFVGGTFSRIGNYQFTNLAHINSNFTVDAFFAANPDGRVRCIALDSLFIYVGGDFKTIGTAPLNYAAKLNRATGTADSIWNPEPDSAIYAIAFQPMDSALGILDDYIYLGGVFTSCGGWFPASNIMKVDNITGYHIGTGTFNFWNAQANGKVRTIAIKDTLIFIAGDFGQVNGVPRTRFAILDDNATDLDFVFLLASTTSFSDKVYSIFLTDSSMLACGNFTQSNSQVREYVAYFNLSVLVNTVSISLKPWSVFPASKVYDVSLDDSIIYLAGRFLSINSVNRKYAAAVSEQTGAVLNWNPHCSAPATAVCAKGDTIIMAGLFKSIGGVDRNNLTQINLNTGRPTNWNLPGTSNEVLCFDTIGSTLYAGGDFISLGGVIRNHFGAIDMYSGTVSAFHPDVDGSVRCLARDASRFYLGGLFTTVGGETRNNAVCVNISSGSVTGWNPDVNGTVNSIVQRGGKVFLSGYFTHAGYYDRNRLAKADTTNGLIDYYWDPDADNGVYTLAEHGGSLYAGGFFSSVGGESRSNICKIDTGGTGEVLNWNPSANGSIRKLLKYSDTLYACGDFTTIDGQNNQRLARFDLNTGTVMNWNPSIDNSVTTICQGVNKVYAGGLFSYVNSNVRYYISSIGWLNTVGFPEPVSESSLLIYPNPNDGNFSVSIPEDLRDETSISIYTPAGQKILENKAAENNLTVDISGEPAGIYFIRVICGEKTFGKKIIKNY